MPVKKAKAAALASVYSAASAKTKCFPPEASFQAEQAVAVILASWQPLEQHCPISLRARLTIDLVAADAAKAERFTEARRAARLDEALARDHMAFLREVALMDEGTARLWWLHRNLTGSEPATSWEVFNDVVRPLIAIGEPDDPLTRLARTVLTLSDRLNENPQRLHTLANIAELTLRASGMPDAADEVASYVRSQPGSDGHE
jgi:hypothetical protein